MKISKGDIKKFRNLYRNNFGESLTDKQAKSQLSSLVRLMDITGQAVYEEQFINLLRRDTKLGLEIVRARREATR